MILPDWVGRLAALALLAMTVAAVHLLAVAPLYDSYRRNGEAIIETRDLLARFDRQAAARSRLEDQLAALRELVARQGHYLDGTTYAVAAASLQDNVKAIVETQGGDRAEAAVGPVGLSGRVASGVVVVRVRAEPLALGRLAGRHALQLDNVVGIGVG